MGLGASWCILLHFDPLLTLPGIAVPERSRDFGVVYGGYRCRFRRGGCEV